MECKLNEGGTIPRLGMGTWFLGEGHRPAAEETSALLAGIDAGIRLIDTAEMYGGGRSEELVGQVLRVRNRDRIFLVSKVYPHNAGQNHIYAACENSLRRMGTDYMDIYLLHWRGSIPLQETVDCMETLVRQGKIRHWGVSNFDLEDMEELFSCENGDHCAVNQVLYHLGSRGVEVVLQPWLRQHGVPLMAYCPLAQAGRLRKGLVEHPAIKEVAEEANITPMQVLLGFVLAQENTTAIPRSGSANHILLNAAMMQTQLTKAQLNKLNAMFRAPMQRVPLDIE